MILTCNKFAQADQPDSNNNSQNQIQQLSDMDKQIKETFQVALSMKLPLDDEQIAQIYENAPQYLKDYVDLIKKIENSYKNRENKKWDNDAIPKRLLLVGPPGVGKSTLAIIVAYMLKYRYIFIKMPLLSNEFRNSEIANLARILAPEFYTKNPIVIIFDEINIFANTRESQFGKEMNASAALWLLLDQLNRNPNILVIATANDVSQFPPQLKDRFEGNIVELTAQDSYSQRFDIICRLLENKGGYEGSSKFLQQLVNNTLNFSYRRLTELINNAYRQHLLHADLKTPICQKDLEYAYKKFEISSDVLKSKKSFDLKNWIKENSVVIQTASTSLNLMLLLTSITYVAVTGKSIR